VFVSSAPFVYSQQGIAKNLSPAFDDPFFDLFCLSV
jgi:hypothetical protein